MSKQLIKQPNMVVFWLVLASGLAVVLTGRSEAAGGVLSTVARTVFWCSVVAYFSLRIFQYATRRNEAEETEPGSDESPADDV